MRRPTALLALAIVLQGACTQGPRSASPPLDERTTAGTTSDSTSPAPSESGSASAPPQPTPIPPPAINPEFFDQAEVEHEYWPAVRQAAGLWEEAHFARMQTGWAISPDGRYIAVAGCDGEAGDGELFEMYDDSSCPNNALSMVSRAFLLILDAKTESIIGTLPPTGEEVTVRQLEFTHDSSKLVYVVDGTKYDPITYEVGGEPPRIEIWDVPSGHIEAEIPGHAGYLISPDDKLVLGTEEKTQLWDITEGDFVGELPADEAGATFVFSSDGTRLLVGESPYLAVYETGTWRPISRQIMMPDGLENVWAIAPDLSMLAVCNKRLPDSPVSIWAIGTGEKIQSLDGTWGRCGRLLFSPDGQLLLRFDEHGAGPVIWRVADWKLVQSNPNVTDFVGFEDYFVDRMEFPQDGRSVLVGTHKRLTLYTLPAEIAAPTAAPVAATATAVPASIGLPEIPAMSCEITVIGWVEATLRPCLNQFDRPRIGEYDGHSGLLMSMREWKTLDESPSGLDFDIPLIYLIRDQLQTGEYIIGDGTEPGTRITARFLYFYLDPSGGFAADYYDSYDGGTFVVTQTGKYLSGTFSFGARTDAGRQITVEGSFENIPFNTVNIPPE